MFQANKNLRSYWLSAAMIYCLMLRPDLAFAGNDLIDEVSYLFAPDKFAGCSTCAASPVQSESSNANPEDLHVNKSMNTTESSVNHYRDSGHLLEEPLLAEMTMRTTARKHSPSEAHLYVVGIGSGPGILVSSSSGPSELRNLLEKIRPSTVYINVPDNLIEYLPDNYLSYELSHVILPYARENKVKVVGTSTSVDPSNDLYLIDVYQNKQCKNWDAALLAGSDLSKQQLGILDESIAGTLVRHYSGRSYFDIAAGTDKLDSDQQSQPQLPWRSQTAARLVAAAYAKSSEGSVVFFVNRSIVQPVVEYLKNASPGLKVSTTAELMKNSGSDQKIPTVDDLKSRLSWLVESSLRHTHRNPIALKSLSQDVRMLSRTPDGEVFGAYYAARLLSAIDPQYAEWIFDSIASLKSDEDLSPYKVSEWRLRMTIIESALYESARLKSLRGDNAASRILVERLKSRLENRLSFAMQCENRGPRFATTLGDRQFERIGFGAEESFEWKLSADVERVTLSRDREKDSTEPGDLVISTSLPESSNEAPVSIALSQIWSIPEEIVLHRGRSLGILVKVKGKVRGSIVVGDRGLALINLNNMTALPESHWFPLMTHHDLKRTGRVIVSFQCEPGSQIRLNRVFGDEFTYVPAKIESYLLRRCIFEAEFICK